MIRVGKAKRKALIQARNIAWAGYCAKTVAVRRHDADAAANRPASHHACQDMADKGLYARMYMRADKAAARCGV